MKAITEMMGQVRELKIGVGARVTEREQARSGEIAKARRIKGCVRAIENREIWTSLGSDHGFVKGDQVAVYKPITRKNRKGEIVATTYEQVSVLTLLKVQKDCSVAEYSGRIDIHEDWPVAAAELDIEQL